MRTDDEVVAPGGAVSPDDAALLDAARSGDGDAFRALWKPAERQAFGLCLRLTGNHADALDALQDTQIAVWRNLHRFDARGPFGAWVFAIARNAATALLRKRGRRAEVDLDDTDDRLPATGAALFSDVVVETMTVQAALETLPERHREALLLCVGGLSHAEVARLMGAEPGAVRVWVHRARAALKPLVAG